MERFHIKGNATSPGLNLSPNPDGDWVKAADAQAAIAALQARVQELESAEKTYQGVLRQAYTVQNDLTQRTAELEAVSNFIGVQYDAESRTWVSGQAPYQSAGTTKQEACIAAVDALRLACATWETKCRDLHAELERVSALVKALPKVEGEIEVSSGVYNFILLKHDSGTRFLCGQIETEQTARAIAALWQHRQGMEG